MDPIQTTTTTTNLGTANPNLGSAILVQGAPLGNAGIPISTTQQTGVPVGVTGVQQTGVPVGVTGIQQTGVPVGVTGIQQTGVPAEFTTLNRPGVDTTGLAGVSQATVHGITQGNVSKAAVGNPQGLLQTNVLPGHTVPGNTTAQGSFTFRPMEGRFVKDKDPIGKMDPYVKVKLGWHTGKTGVAKSQGTNPVWVDSITLPRKHNETFAKLKIKDKDKITLNDRIGEVKINLDEVVQKGRISQWYPVTHKDQPRGEILVDVEYAPLFIK